MREAGEGETLGALLFSERLHRRRPAWLDTSTPTAKPSGLWRLEEEPLRCAEADSCRLRFPYVSFYGRRTRLKLQGPDDYAVGGSVSEASGPGLEFERLQQALQQNLQALQDLRSRLAPYQESSRSSLFWTWSDVVNVATRFREALCFPAKAAKAAAGGLNRLDEVVRSAQLKKLSLNFFFALDYALFI
ncbi:Hypothetical protein SCF082_LOCUS17684 [Durusdinium trenchii]|uniref:Uncharacterized protein n=1 Tax=Durusdinium trenchii TaxID=1381693 RepID=A0ABP0KJ23_9DINO